ncbi:NnrS family protein [Duganella sp. FT135W]|uniref:NnrS family protein n=1 Tax=Duganella flavida TaxID=2692175 RepID=A0A6L8K7W4_9BURK|nr:NnrS family protein [Duganella flavida]MYM22637.1 NnrS family protein [Duganella flavida]
MKTSSSFLSIGEPPSGGGTNQLLLPRGFALFRLGFRPLYLGAAIVALLGVPLWLNSFFGHADVAPGVNVLWHMHEMVLGFATAVVFGFLYTAVKNWTGLPTPRNMQLAAIVATWLAGRLAMLGAPALTAACLDLLFIPIAISPLLGVMLRSGKRSNLPLLVLPALLFCVNLCFHASVLGWLAVSPITAIESGILVLAILSTVMAGRVVPGFTRNMAPASVPQSFEWLNRIGIALIIASSLAWALSTPVSLTAPLATGAGLIQLSRLAYWQPEKTVRYPLLWILHLAFGWIGLGYILLALSVWGVCSTSTAMHAIAVGGMSSLILGMMTRTSIGHTGRPMRAEHNERLIFLSIQGAAVTRVLANILPFEARVPLLIVAGCLWSLAFLVFIVRFAPFLCQPRIDHREG